MALDERENEPDLTDVGRRLVLPTAGLFLLIAVLIAVDVVGDYRSGTRALHLAVELVVMALSLTGVAVLWRLLRAAQQRAAFLSANLETARAEAQRFGEEARDALRGLGEAIDRQFQRWALTAAEREVGLLLLKGFTHREIGGFRNTSELTVRQQALSIYRKAGLRGRTELSAFFLEDLLLPAGEAAKDTA